MSEVDYTQRKIIDLGSEKIDLSEPSDCPRTFPIYTLPEFQAVCAIAAGLAALVAIVELP